MGQVRRGEMKAALGLEVVEVSWVWEEPFPGAKVGEKGVKEVKVVEKGAGMEASH